MAFNNNNIFKNLDYKQIPILHTSECEVCVAFITTPSTEYSEEGQYFLRVRLKSKTPECKKLIQQIEDARENAYNMAMENLDSPKAKKNLKYAETSYKEEEDDNGNPTGYTVFNFKQKAKFLNKKGEEKAIILPLFDRMGRPITGEDKENLQLWGGSLVSVAFRLIPYYTERLGVGVSQRLEAVQVLKAVSSASRSAEDYGFSVEEMPDDEDTSDASAEDVSEDEGDF